MKIEEEVQAAVDVFIGSLAALSQEPYIKDGIAKMAVRDVTWGLVHRLGISQYDLEEDLRGMADVVKDHVLVDDAP